MHFHTLPAYMCAAQLAASSEAAVPARAAALERNFSLALTCGLLSVCVWSVKRVMSCMPKSAACLLASSYGRWCSTPGLPTGGLFCPGSIFANLLHRVALLRHARHLKQLRLSGPLLGGLLQGGSGDSQAPRRQYYGVRLRVAGARFAASCCAVPCRTVPCCAGEIAVCHCRPR